MADLDIKQELIKNPLSPSTICADSFNAMNLVSRTNNLKQYSKEEEVFIIGQKDQQKYTK